MFGENIPREYVFHSRLGYYSTMYVISLYNRDSFINGGATDNGFSSRIASLETNCLYPRVYKPDIITGRLSGLYFSFRALMVLLRAYLCTWLREGDMIFGWNEQSVVSLRAPQPKNSSNHNNGVGSVWLSTVMRPKVCSMYKNRA